MRFIGAAAPLLPLLLLPLWMLQGRALALCPPSCECSEAASTVKCVSRELRGPPPGIPDYTRNLFITGNRIRRLEPDSFAGLGNLVSLSLSGNRISELAAGAFSGLSRLRSLDLSNNRLTLVPPAAFAGLGPSLRELNLSRALYNHSAVGQLGPALRWSSLEGLQILDLSHNGLVYLPPRLFSHLGGLRRLQLSNNSLVALHNTTLAGLTALAELDLTLNAFKVIPAEGQRELDSVPGATILLGRNPFSCSCGAEPFALWLNGSQARVADAADLTCSSPVSMRNTSLLSLGDLTLGCPQRDARAELALQTSYVFLGLVLGAVGLVFLLVLFLNRRGIKRRVNDMRDACREVWEGYHYRYELDSDPRGAQVSDT